MGLNPGAPWSLWFIHGILSLMRHAVACYSHCASYQYFQLLPILDYSLCSSVIPGTTTEPLGTTKKAPLEELDRPTLHKEIFSDNYTLTGALI